MKFCPTKFQSIAQCFLLAFLCIGPRLCLALDREAFTFTNYDLNLQIEPEQHRLGVRGKISLRNDSPSPQKIAVLQITSSLDWRAIKAGDKSLQFVTQPYTSDIDHTGSLSEAIVTLSQAVPARETIELDIAYEGVILPDATRLTRIGAPPDVVKSTDWDQIDPSFSAMRGAGYVAWYPIATDVANLSETGSLFEVLGRWKAREAGSKMHLRVTSTQGEEDSRQIVFEGLPCTPTGSAAGQVQADCPVQALGLSVPAVVVADYQALERTAITVRFLKGHDDAAAKFADAAETTAPLIADWFGSPRQKASVNDLPDPTAAPFESGALLLTPLAAADEKLSGLAAAHQLTHATFLSFRPWIEEGLAHFAQALYLEQQKGRQAALDYMGLHRTALVQIEQPDTGPRSDEEAGRALVSTTNEELYRSKAMCVWWMLRDMIGDAALKKALASYRPEQDNDRSYMARLISAQTQRDLAWFFDDWVYHDRGLPEFKVESAFSRKATTDTFMVTVTIDNVGTAVAEVPLRVKFAGGEVARRVEVRGKNKAVIRVETPAAPEEIVVNDGSVPETNPGNNVFRVQPTGPSQNTPP